MRKPNSSGRSRNSKDSSQRPDSKGRSFTKKPAKSGFKKSDSDDTSKPRFGGKPSGSRPRRDDTKAGGPSSRGGFRSRPSKPEGESSFGPRKRRSFDKPDGPSDRKGSDSRSETPFKKRSFTDKPFDKPRRRQAFDKPGGPSDREGNASRTARPFKKSSGDKPFDKPSRPRKSFSADSRSSDEGPREIKKFDRSGIIKRGKNNKVVAEETSGSPASQGQIRLNKYIANSGVCSRREADQLITMGLISVNGKVITTLGYKVNPGDEVRHEAKVLKAEKPVYILMNKPKGFLTTTADPQERNTVMQIVGNFVKERVYPVGRLDRNTTGLLLLTNDGDLAEKLMHPSYNVKKIYKVELDKPLTKADATRIMEGVKLEEGHAVVDDLAIISDDRKTVGLEIHIGWNRVVRRIFESLEYQVVKLDRSLYAGLTKKDLGRGEWRFLTKEELVLLKHYK